MKHRDFSAVNHIARDKGIAPFMLLFVADHPDTSTSSQTLGLRLNGIWHYGKTRWRQGHESH